MGEDEKIPHDYVDVEPYGKLHCDQALFFREHVGEATSSEDNAYEMSLNMGGMHPIIHSKKTGKWFTLNWHDIIDMAIEAGIDEEGSIGEEAQVEDDDGDADGAG